MSQWEVCLCSGTDFYKVTVAADDRWTVKAAVGTSASTNRLVQRPVEKRGRWCSSRGPPQGGRTTKAVGIAHSLFFTCRGLVRAGEEEEDGALPTASDEGQAEPCDSSLWCCSGDRLSLLLSSSNAYESSCLGNLPWFTVRRADRRTGGRSVRWLLGGEQGESCTNTLRLEELRQSERQQSVRMCDRCYSQAARLSLTPSVTLSPEVLRCAGERHVAPC